MRTSTTAVIEHVITMSASEEAIYSLFESRWQTASLCSQWPWL